MLSLLDDGRIAMHKWDGQRNRVVMMNRNGKRDSRFSDQGLAVLKNAGGFLQSGLGGSVFMSGVQMTADASPILSAYLGKLNRVGLPDNAFGPNGVAPLPQVSSSLDPSLDVTPFVTQPLVSRAGALATLSNLPNADANGNSATQFIGWTQSATPQPTWRSANLLFSPNPGDGGFPAFFQRIARRNAGKFVFTSVEVRASKSRPSKFAFSVFQPGETAPRKSFTWELRDTRFVGHWMTNNRAATRLYICGENRFGNRRSLAVKSMRV